MKDQKKVYRQNFDNLKQTKSQLFYISQTIDTLKQQLVSTFEEWYSQTFDEDELMQSTLVRNFQAQFNLQQKTSKTMLNTSAKKDARGNTSMK